MSDLIARIECELECKSWDEDTTKAFTDCKAEIERLSAVGEPVAYIAGEGYIPDDTAPPSVAALIAELDAIHPHPFQGNTLNRSEVIAILDKYRSAK